LKPRAAVIVATHGALAHARGPERQPRPRTLAGGRRREGPRQPRRALREKSFAILFVVLLGLPALPLPTGGATHVFEIIAIVLALQLIAGREHIWLPERWRRLELAGPRQQRFVMGLMKFIRFLERFSRPRLTFLFDHRLSNIVFGLLVIAGCAGAFLAPPFTGLDTLPSLGVVLLSLGVLLEDFLLVVLGIAVGVAGVFLEIVLGKAAVKGIGSLF
jgi:hypothetical protein